MTTTELLNMVLEIIQRVMGELFRNYWLTVFGCIFLSLFLSLFLVRKNKKQSYTSALECTMVFHWILIIGKPLLSGYLVWRFFGYNVLYPVLTIVSLIIALYSSYLLIRMKWQGVVFADLSLILDTFAYNHYVVSMIHRTFAEMGQYSPAGMYALTGVSYMWIFKVMLTLIAFCIAFCVIAAYYSRRYYLFFKGDLPVESVCPVCGSPVFEGEHFCAMCGNELPADITGKADYLLRGEEKYCTNCGHMLRKGQCSRCGYCSPSVKELQGDLIDDLFKKIQGFAWIGLFIALGIIPVIFNPALDISDGSAVIHNAYLEKLNEYYADHSIAENDEWLADYREKYDALVKKDNEWAEIDFRLMTSGAIPFFTAYSEAAYNQVEVMESIDAEIHMSARGEEISEDAFDSQLDFFDQTVEDMGDSYFYHTSMTADWSVLRRFLNYFVDGLQYYSRFIDLVFIGILMLAAAAVFYVLLMLDFREDEKLTKLLDPRYAFKVIIRWIGETLGGSQDSAVHIDSGYRKDRLLYFAAVAGLCLLFIGAAFLFGGHFLNDEDKEKLYIADCSEVLIQTMQEQQLCVNQLLKRNVSAEDVQLIIETFEKEIERDQNYLLKEDIPETFTEFDARMDELCETDIALLNDMLDVLRQNQRPSRESLVRLCRLRIEEYQDVVYGYANFMIMQAMNALSG